MPAPSARWASVTGDPEVARRLHFDTELDTPSPGVEVLAARLREPATALWQLPLAHRQAPRPQAPPTPVRRRSSRDNEMTCELQALATGTPYPHTRRRPRLFSTIPHLRPLHALHMSRFGHGR